MKFLFVSNEEDKLVLVLDGQKNVSKIAGMCCQHEGSGH